MIKNICRIRDRERSLIGGKFVGDLREVEFLQSDSTADSAKGGASPTLLNRSQRDAVSLPWRGIVDWTRHLRDVGARGR